MDNPIRVATAALSERIYAGRPTKDGKSFKEPRYDVTSDVLAAVRDKIGMGHEITVERDGVPEFRIAILEPRANDQAKDEEIARYRAALERAIDTLDEMGMVHTADSFRQALGEPS